MQHPKSAKKWDQVAPTPPASPTDRAAAFSKALKDKTLDLGKGDFAHVIAELIENGAGAGFEVPTYLTEAIRAAIIPPRSLRASEQADGHA